jgi:hypothetical protein
MIQLAITVSLLFATTEWLSSGSTKVRLPFIVVVGNKSENLML